eukprot:15448834-Alexandrium_andersonii.AAC.1
MPRRFKPQEEKAAVASTPPLSISSCARICIGVRVSASPCLSVAVRLHVHASVCPSVRLSASLSRF